MSDGHGAPTWSRTHGPEPIHHQVAQVVHQAAPPPPPPGFVAPAAFVVNPRHYDIQPRKLFTFQHIKIKLKIKLYQLVHMSSWK